MKSDNLYMQMLDARDELKSAKTLRNVYLTGGTLCTAMSLIALSSISRYGALAPVTTGVLTASGATISFYKYNQKIDEIRKLRLDLINLKHSYEKELLRDSQDFHKHIKTKSYSKVA